MSNESVGINLDSPYRPAVLAGLFDMSPSNIYQLVDRGIILKDCTYRKAVQSYVQYWESTSKRKAGSIAEISMARRAEHERAKTILAWLDIREKRGELVDKLEFLDLVSPVFSSLKSELIALIRKYPDLKGDIDKILTGIADSGNSMKALAGVKFDEFVDSEVSVMEELEEEIKLKAMDREQAVDTDEDELNQLGEF